MKPTDLPVPDQTADQPILHRRKLLGAVGTSGALAAAAALVATRQADPVAAQPQAGAAPEQTGGYQLTEHVQRYYQTARV
jgi:hypothetical protein